MTENPRLSPNAFAETCGRSSWRLAGVGLPHIPSGIRRVLSIERLTVRQYRVYKIRGKLKKNGEVQTDPKNNRIRYMRPVRFKHPAMYFGSCE